MTTLRSSLASLGLIATAGAVLPAQQVTLQAAPSTRATTTVNLTPPRGTTGLSPARITIDYGQPHLRGRKLHTADLVPLDSVWRLGANEATGLDTGVDLVIGGQRIPKGKYSLFALPTSGGWKLIINRNTGQWGTQYNAEYDIARVDLRKRTLASPVESLSIWLIPSTTAATPSGELRFAWGDAELSTTWSVPTGLSTTK
jgi:hypothetical protein